MNPAIHVDGMSARIVSARKVVMTFDVSVKLLRARYLLLFVLAAAEVTGQPFIAYRGVVNAASSMTPGLPGGSIARGSAFTIDMIILFL